MKTRNNSQNASYLCPPHFGLYQSGKLTEFENCIACTVVQRDELKQRLDATVKAVNKALQVLSGQYQELTDGQHGSIESWAAVKTLRQAMNGSLITLSDGSRLNAILGCDECELCPLHGEYEI